MPSPLKLHTFGAFSYSPSAVLGPRIRNQFELVWPLTEWFDVRVGASRLHFESGDCLLLRPLEENTFFFSPSGVTRHGYLTFQILDEALAARVRALPTRLTPGPFQSLFDKAISALHSVEESKPSDLEQMSRLLMSFLDICDWPAIQAQAAPQRRRTRLDRVLSMIDAEVAGGALISVGELASRAGITERQLGRLFQQTFHCAPSNYIRRRRLAHGAQLLRRSELGLSEVAALCGFGTPYAFSRAFRDVYGLPPGRYRKQVRNSPQG